MTGAQHDVPIIGPVAVPARTTDDTVPRRAVPSIDARIRAATTSEEVTSAADSEHAIIAVLGREDVYTGATVAVVPPAPTVDMVLSSAGHDVVITATREDDVATATRSNDIVARESADDIVARRSAYQVILARADGGAL